MLRDGKFIKEDPPKIGSHYVPQFYTSVASSEPTVEYQNRWRNVNEKYLSSVDVGAWIVLFYTAIAVVLTIVRAMFDWLMR
jgi:hypothetical protein